MVEGVIGNLVVQTLRLVSISEHRVTITLSRTEIKTPNILTSMHSNKVESCMEFTITNRIEFLLEFWLVFHSLILLIAEVI